MIVEDNIVLGEVLSRWIGKVGIDADIATHEPAARRRMESKDYSLVLTDVRLPKGDGLSLLEWSMTERHGVPFVVMTDYASVPDAVRAVKMGAEDYLPKPVHEERLTELLGNIIGNVGKAFGNERSLLRRRSPQALAAEDMAKRVAGTDWSVMILGPNGSGKESVARTVHRHSLRKDKPFVPVNCGAVPKELAASEFFGHVKGSFTGALSDKIGAFVEANGGTLFLDEIGNLGYEVQVQLLRAIQERKVRPVGSTKEVDVDVRLICATNGNLRQAIAKGTFREDLYHRVNEFTLRMPSLSERKEDIMLFANLFLDQANRELSRNLVGFEPAAERALVGYSWPGNLRQLKNVVKRAALLARGKRIEWSDIAGELPEPENANSFLLHDAQEEKARIIDMLKKANNNKSKAAAMLGIDRKTLYNKLKQYGIS